MRLYETRVVCPNRNDLFVPSMGTQFRFATFASQCKSPAPGADGVFSKPRDFEPGRPPDIAWRPFQFFRTTCWRNRRPRRGPEPAPLRCYRLNRLACAASRCRLIRSISTGSVGPKSDAPQRLAAHEFTGRPGVRRNHFPIAAKPSGNNHPLALLQSNRAQCEVV